MDNLKLTPAQSSILEKMREGAKLTPSRNFYYLEIPPLYKRRVAAKAVAALRDLGFLEKVGAKGRNYILRDIE